ncbi:MAG: dihydrofolate reductase [Bacteroidaceae bacterium]|nr:dihydrofolate reductase [Bacteroidaceae bacterium]
MNYSNTDNTAFQYADIRFADIQLLRYRVPEFENLTLTQKLYVYHLSEAALCGRDILWDQNCRHNIDVRHLLEDILLHSGIEHQGAQWQAFLTYIRQVWFANGIHHHYSTDKFTPKFSAQWLEEAYKAIPSPIMDESRVMELIHIITDPTIMPKRVCQNAEDLLLASACNYYAEGIRQVLAEDFYAKKKASAIDANRPVMYGMNSRLELDEEGNLRENTYSTQGLYASHLNRICSHLEKAQEYAENQKQRDIINLLLQFYRTGSLETFDQYTIAWVGETEGNIDFINGFTEVYGDPLGLKASWEGYVNILDKQATRRTEVLSQNAQWFEDNSPVDSRFKKKECKGVTARVVQAAMLGGDLYPSSAIGINLPNSNWVRSVHGSKSVTIGNLTEAYDQAAQGNGFRQEFIRDKETLKMVNKYAHQLDDLHTDLHECLGHGSGQLLPGVDADALGVHGSTIEETRADLFALYYIADQKMYQLGLTPTPDAWHSNYYTYMLNGLMTQLVRIQPGCQIEEAHMRNRALIAHWCLEQSTHWANIFGTIPAMQLVKREDKTELLIHDYPTLRQFIGQLLAEIQRIKSEGDTLAAKHLVEKYGVDIDATLHTEILERYQKLDLAPYKGFINPCYSLQKDPQGNVVDVLISYDESFDSQMLRYGQEYA